MVVLAWARFSLSRFESGWAAILPGVLAIVAVGVRLSLNRGTRVLGTGLCVVAVGGLTVAVVVARAV